MTNTMRRYPLITRLTLALALLATLALASIYSALELSQRIEGDARAINMAGSLRMTAYRVLAAERDTAAPENAGQWRADFLNRLRDPAMTNAVPTNDRHPVRSAYAAVESAWAVSPLSAQQQPTTTQDADQLVDTIDRLVAALETESDRKLHLLRVALFGFAAAAGILIGLIGLWFWRTVVGPLTALALQADALSQKQWQARSMLQSKDELGALSRSLDHMASELAISYADMQHQIDERTAHLSAAQSRTAVLNERAAIARELHDSLAQTLTYEKIQLTLLDNQLTKAAVNPRLWENALDDLRHTVNDSYRQLRELLVTFRLPLNHDSLDDALVSTLEELSKQSTIELSIQGEFTAVTLSSQQEIHVLHIIREALLNVIHHSGASQAKVIISCHRKRIQVQILDNGVGLRQSDAPDHRSSQHFGLQILLERARQLQGTLTIGDRTDAHGTAVTLEFPLEDSDRILAPHE